MQALIWVDRIQRLGHMAACLGQDGVDGWVGIATLSPFGTATLITPSGVTVEDIGLPKRKYRDASSGLDEWNRLDAWLRLQLNIV